MTGSNSICVDRVTLLNDYGEIYGNIDSYVQWLRRCGRGGVHQ